MRTRPRAGVALMLSLAPLALLAACSSAPPEQQFLTQFFRAARTRDNETVARMSAVEFRPTEQGEVTSFEITNISDERRAALDYKSLIATQQRVSAELEEARARRREFEGPNMAALREIAKLEQGPAPKLNPAQQKLKAEWDVHRQKVAELEKSAASAKMAFTNAAGAAEASLAQPGQAPFAADKFEGELVSKDVTLNAQLRKGNETTQKTLIVTLQRVEGTLNGTRRTGRPIITRIQGA